MVIHAYNPYAWSLRQEVTELIARAIQQYASRKATQDWSQGDVQRVKMLVAKHRDLNLIPRTHTTKKTSFRKLASDLLSHTHTHKINKCKRIKKALTATSMIITSNKTSPTTCSHRKGGLSVPMPLLEPSFWSLALQTWAPGSAQSLRTSSPQLLAAE